MNFICNRFVKSCLFLLCCLLNANSSTNFQLLRSQWETRTGGKPALNPSETTKLPTGHRPAVPPKPKLFQPADKPPTGPAQATEQKKLTGPRPAVPPKPKLLISAPPSGEAKSTPRPRPTIAPKPAKLEHPTKQEDPSPDLTPTYNRSRLIDSLKVSLDILYTPSGAGLLTKKGTFLVNNEEAQQYLKEIGFSNALAAKMIFSMPEKRLEAVSKFKEEHKEDMSAPYYKRMIDHTERLLHAIQEHNREIKKKLSTTKSPAKSKKIANFYLLIQEHRLLDIYEKITKGEPLIKSDIDAYIGDINLIAAMYNAVISKIDQLP